jgi:hypothetical protein
MRHFLLVSGIVIGNFILWALITVLPVHAMVMFCLAVGVGCLMIYLLVRIGRAADHERSAKGLLGNNLDK